MPPHFTSLLRLARRELKGKAWDGFLSDTLSMELAALERLEGELKHFTTMFDYRNAGADWGSSRDALPRVIAKLRGAPRRTKIRRVRSSACMGIFAFGFARS